jgi:hypothetical protein
MTVRADERLADDYGRRRLARLIAAAVRRVAARLGWFTVSWSILKVSLL